MSFPSGFQSLARALSVASLVLVAAWAEAWGAERIPGTRVTLQPPQGFTPATQFPGYQRADAASSIMVTEIPAAADQLRAAMTRDGLARQGMTLLTASPGSVSGLDATLLHVSQSAGGATFEKWMILFGDQANTVMVVATYPQALAASLSEPMKQSVLSARWDPSQSVGLFDGLTFRVAESDTLKFARRISNMIMLTEGGHQEQVGPSEPFAVVGTSLHQVAIADVETFSKQRLAQTTEITGLTNLQGRAITVDGLPAYELTAEANDLQSGTPLSVYQLVAAEGQAYFLIQGLVGRAKGQRFLPEFRAIASSLRRAR